MGQSNAATIVCVLFVPVVLDVVIVIAGLGSGRVLARFLGNRLSLVVTGAVPDVPCHGFDRDRVRFIRLKIVILMAPRLGQRNHGIDG